MDQTILFVFPRHSDFGRLTTAGDVRIVASDLANIQRLLEATPDDLSRELGFVAQRILTDAPFAVRYESLLMALTDDRSFDAWACSAPHSSRSNVNICVYCIITTPSTSMSFSRTSCVLTAPIS